MIFPNSTSTIHHPVVVLRTKTHISLILLKYLPQQMFSFVLFVWWFIIWWMIISWMQVLENIWCQVNWCQSGCIFLPDAKTFSEIHIQRWTHKQSGSLLEKFLKLFSRQKSSSISNSSLIPVAVIALAGISKVGWPWTYTENGVSSPGYIPNNQD